MKTSKIMGSLVAATVIIAGVWAAGEVSEESLGLRKVDVYTEYNAMPNETNYTKDAPGSSKKFERAFTNAPPMIPHDISELPEIDKADNACLSCHMPDVAKALGATPIPKSHFTSFRPTVTQEGDDGFKSDAACKVVKKDLKGDLWKGRWNCTQCHAPQTQGKLKVESTFKADYTDKKGQKHQKSSYLMDELEDGVRPGNSIQ